MEDNAVLALSEVLGDLGQQVSAKDLNVDRLKQMILQLAPKPLDGQALQLARENREMQIRQFVGTKITPAIANYLYVKYSGPQSLVLSHGDYSDGFDAILDMIKMLPDLELADGKSQTKPQVMDRPKEMFTAPDPFAEAFNERFSDEQMKQERAALEVN